MDIRNPKITKPEYNKILTSEFFWNNIVGDKVFLYQEDSIIFKSNIDDFINVSNDDKKELQDMLKLCDNLDSSLDVNSYKLIPRYIAIINEFSAIGIMEYIKNIKKDELYSNLKTYLSAMKDKIDSNNEYINHQYNIIKNLNKQINDYMSKNGTISIDIIENILF